jgi:hypothetical protein
VLRLFEVLRGEQLHGRRLGQRRPDGVGADRGLRPAGSLGEAERVGARPHPGGALAPQDHPVGVGDHHEERRGVGDATRMYRRPSPGEDRVVHADQHAGVLRQVGAGAIAE